MNTEDFQKLKDHQIAMLVNALRDTAVKYHDHQSLRERIAQLMVPALQGKGIPELTRMEGLAVKRPMADESVKSCIRTVFLKNGFTIKEGETDLKQYVYDAALELIASLGYRATPPAYWWINGQEDPHGAHYAAGVERSTLTLGDLTDDELAIGLFLNYDRKLSAEESPKGRVTPIAWANAAKERIRWLSRSLTNALSRLNITQEKLEALKVQYLRDGQAADKRYTELLKSRNFASQVPAVEDGDVDELRNQWDDHMEDSFKTFESRLKGEWRDLLDSVFDKVEKTLHRARLHGYDAGRRADDTNAASADEQQRPFPSRTAGEVESTTGFHVMESAGAKEVIDALVADALMAASQGNASNVGDVLADSVERPDVNPIPPKGAVYGYCPICGAQVHSRERKPDGNDTCLNGHVYPSSQSLESPKGEARSLEERQQRKGN